MREAMFPSIELTLSASNAIEFDAAVGKTYIVQKADSLTPPLTWQGISTQTLTTPKFSFPNLGLDGPGGFYRVQWVK